MTATIDGFNTAICAQSAGNHESSSPRDQATRCPKRRKRQTGERVIGNPFLWGGRNRYAIDIIEADGRKRRETFETLERAQDRRSSLLLPSEATPSGRAFLGGPQGMTVGRMLGEYAGQVTIYKDGAQQEISMVNRYLRAAHLPEFRVVANPDGSRQLVVVSTDPSLPRSFQERIDAIHGEQPHTIECIDEVANLQVLDVGEHHIHRLMNAMQLDGLSDSTRMKYHSLLRHAFNVARDRWHWYGLGNPCTFKDFDKVQPKVVIVSDVQIQLLRKALRECRDLVYLQMFELALSTALRPGSILQLQWRFIDLENKTLSVRAKGRFVTIPLSPYAVDVLRGLQRPGMQYVFDSTGEGLRQAWRSVRESAGLPDLQFQDLRHVAATRLARNGLNVFTLRDVLGHTTTRMAEWYVNLASGEQQQALAEAESKRRDIPRVSGPSAPVQLDCANRAGSECPSPTSAAPTETDPLQQARPVTDSPRAMPAVHAGPPVLH